MTAGRLVIATLIGLAGTASAAAEDLVVCTPEFYFNSSEATALVIPIDASRMGGRTVTTLDLETGAFHDNIRTADGREVARGTLSIVNPGSHQERIDFVALDAKTGLLMRLSFVDGDPLPFTRIDDEGTVSSGHCEFTP
jgi:hypothetical protein